MSYDVGDVARIRLVLRDFDGELTDGTVTLTVRHPDGTETTPAPTNESTGVYVADVALDASGVWQYHWTSTGAVLAAESGALAAVDRWSGPVPYVPALVEVADYIPARTVVDGVGSQDPVGTFTSQTTPTDEQVQRIARAAAAYVAARVGTVDPALLDMARAVGAIRAAGMVELAYPIRNDDIDTASRLLEQAGQALDALDSANSTAVDNPAPGGGPRGGFPPASGWPDPALPHYHPYAYGSAYGPPFTS